MTCPDLNNPRVPCTACPDADSVKEFPQGQVMPFATEILNDNFAVLQCLADLCTLGGGGETVTNLVDNGDGTLTYTNEQGTAQTFSVTSSLSFNTTTSVLTFVNPQGVSNDIDLSALAGGTGNTSVLSNVNGTGNRILTHDDGTGNTVDVFESVTTVVDNTDNTYTFTNEAGTPTVIDTNCTFTVNAGTTATVSDASLGTSTMGCGDTLHFWNPNGAVQFVVQEGSAIVGINVVPSTDANNALVLGTDNQLYVPTSATSSFDVTDGTNTQTIASGDTFTFAAGGDLLATVTATDTVTYSFTETHTQFTNLVNGNLIGTFTNENGDTFEVDETVTDLTQNTASGLITFTKEDGTTSVVRVISTDANNSLSVGSDGGVFYDAPAVVTSAAWNDSTNTITLTFDDTSTVDVPIVDDVANFIHTHRFSDTVGNETAVTNGDDVVLTGNGIAVIVSNDAITFSAQVSADANNDLTLGTDGAPYVDVTANETPAVVTTDGNATGVTQSGVNGHTVDIRLLSTDANNDISVGTDGGLFLDVPAASETTTTVTNVQNGNLIATYTNEVGASVDIDETVTSATYNSTNHTISYSDETGTASTLDLNVGSAAFNTVTGILTYTNEEGVTTNLDLNSLSKTSVVTQILNAGNLIARHDDGDGTIVSIFETITTFINNNNRTLTYTSEDGTPTTFTESQIDATLTAASAGTAAPAGMEFGFDETTGATYYVDNAGLWQLVPVSTVDLNTTVSSQSGSNFGGGAAVNPPAGADAGDIHIEVYDDAIVYYTAGAGGVFPATPSAQFSVTPTSLTLAGDAGPTQTLSNGDTLTVSGGLGMLSLTSATDTVTVNHNLGDVALTQATVFDNANDRLYFFDVSDSQLHYVTPNDINILTSIAANANRGFTYTDEAGGTTDILLDGSAFVQDNTGGNVPAVLVDPTVVATPIDGDVVFQDYDNGCVFSIRSGGAWVNKQIASGVGAVSVVTQVAQAGALAGRNIASHADGNGTTVNIQETVTTLTENATARTFTYTSEDNTATTVTLDGRTTEQDNTGGNIPAVLVDPTAVNSVDGDAVFQRYDNGVVFSTFDGTNWTNVAVYNKDLSLDFQKPIGFVEGPVTMARIDGVYVRNGVTYFVENGVFVDMFGGTALGIQPVLNIPMKATQTCTPVYRNYSCTAAGVETETYTDIGGTVVAVGDINFFESDRPVVDVGIYCKGDTTFTTNDSYAGCGKTLTSVVVNVFDEEDNTVSQDILAGDLNVSSLVTTGTWEVTALATDNCGVVGCSSNLCVDATQFNKPAAVNNLFVVGDATEANLGVGNVTPLMIANEGTPNEAYIGVPGQFFTNPNGSPVFADLDAWGAAQADPITFNAGTTMFQRTSGAAGNVPVCLVEEIVGHRTTQTNEIGDEDFTKIEVTDNAEYTNESVLGFLITARLQQFGGSVAPNEFDTSTLAGQLANGGFWFGNFEWEFTEPAPFAVRTGFEVTDQFQMRFLLNDADRFASSYIDGWVGATARTGPQVGPDNGSLSPNIQPALDTGTNGGSTAMTQGLLGADLVEGANTLVDVSSPIWVAAGDKAWHQTVPGNVGTNNSYIAGSIRSANYTGIDPLPTINSTVTDQSTLTNSNGPFFYWIGMRDAAGIRWSIGVQPAAIQYRCVNNTGVAIRTETYDRNGNDIAGNFTAN
jgi:hypothetical protein